MRVVGMSHADMAIRIHNVLAGQDAVGDHEVAHQGGEFTHESPWVEIAKGVGGNGFITLVQSGVSFDWNSTGITTLTTPAARRASSFLPPLAGRIPQAGVAYEPGVAHAAPQRSPASRGAISAPPS